MPESPPGVAFRHANFRYYLMVRVLTTTASEMQAVAVAWQVYALTHRPLDLGLVGLAQFLPGILLFLVAGQTADRFARQRILQACCGGFALCSLMLLGLTWHGLFSVFPIYGVLLLNGIARAFNGPASQAFLPLLVTEEHFPKAVAWNSSIFQAATIAGPVAGGLLYGWTASPAIVSGGAGDVGGYPGTHLARAPSSGVLWDGLGGPAIHPAQQADPGRHLAGPVRRAVGRRRGAAAGLRARDSQNRGIRARNSAERARRGRRHHGPGGDALALAAACRRDHAVVRVRLRGLHGNLWFVAQAGPFAGGISADRRVRQTKDYRED